MPQEQKATKVCILNESDARLFAHAEIAHRCASRRHHHCSRKRADALVKAGELVWVGKHRKMATYQSARDWTKVYTRNAAGETLFCGMQWVRPR